MRADNMIMTPAKSSPSNLRMQSSDDASPTSAAKNRTSGRERANVNYDMRYHPADKILRPNHLHTKRAVSLEAKNDHNYPSVGDDSDSAADNDEQDDEGEQTDEEVVSGEVLERKIGQLSPHSTRSGRSVKPANYNMKHHPMDMLLRPKASEKQATRIDRSSVGSITKKSRKGQSEKTATADSDPAQLGKSVNKFKMPDVKSIGELGKLDHRLLLLAQEPRLSWPHLITKLIKEGLITDEELKDCGGITALQTRVRYISAEFGGQMTLDDNASERPTIKSEPITQQAEYLEDDVINRTASLSADDAGNGNGDIEFRSVSPAVEVEGNPEHALFDETSSITKPYTEFMNEDEVSDLLNEDMETLQDFQPGDDSTQADAHTQQTVQVVIYKAERSKKRPFTPSFERNQRPGSVKKRVNGASEFAIHEDQPGNGSSVKKQIVRRPSSAGSDIPKENLEEDEEARPVTTVDLGVLEIDIRDLSRPVEAYNLLQHGIAGNPDSLPASVRLDLGSRLAPSPYIPIRRPSADDASNAFASRFVAVPAVTVDHAMESGTSPIRYPTDPTRTFFITET